MAFRPSTYTPSGWLSANGVYTSFSSSGSGADLGDNNNNTYLCTAINTSGRLAITIPTSTAVILGDFNFNCTLSMTVANCNTSFVAPAAGGSASSIGTIRGWFGKAPVTATGVGFQTEIKTGNTTLTGAWVTHTWNFSSDFLKVDPTDWSTINTCWIDFDFTGGGGSPANRRGVAVSEVQLTLPTKAFSYLIT